MERSLTKFGGRLNGRGRQPADGQGSRSVNPQGACGGLSDKKTSERWPMTPSHPFPTLAASSAAGTFREESPIYLFICECDCF
jgi:hypothetical protein